MANITKRISKDGKTTFKARVRLKGYPTDTATFERLTDARRWIQQTEAAMREGRYFKTSEARKRTLEQLIDKYLENKLHQRGEDKETVGPQLDWWKEQIGKYLLVDVTPVLLAEYRDKLLKEPIQSGKKQKKPRMLANTTIIRYMASLSVCFTYGIEDLGWIENNPLRQVRKPKPERGRLRFLSEEERDTLLKVCKETTTTPHLYPIVVLALSTGARLSEIMTLTWKQIDFKARMIRLDDTKNGERRSIPLAQHAFNMVIGLNKLRRIDTDYLFAREDGKKPMEIRKQWEKAVKKAELEDFRFHDLRHTAASYLAMNGASLVEISTFLGHKTMSMVKRYAHLTEQHTADILERMNAKQFSVKNV